MTDETRNETARRVFMLAARLQKAEGVKIDVLDPGWRELFDDPCLAELSDEEIHARLYMLVRAEGDAEAEQRAERFRERLSVAADRALEEVKAEAKKKRAGAGVDDVIDATDYEC